MAGRNPLVRAIYDYVMNMKRTGVGAGETLATLASGAVAEPVSGLTGLSVLASTGDPNLAAQAVRSTQEGLTYQPRTLEGQSNLQGTGEILQPVGEAFEAASGGLGSYVQEKTGSPALAAAAHSVPTALGELIGAKGLGRVAKTGPQFEFNDIGSQAHRQKGVFAGVKSKTANLEMQKAAEELARRGVDPEEIWQNTGWFQGADGKWRYEIDDSNFRMNPEASNISESETSYLGDIFGGVAEPSEAMKARGVGPIEYAPLTRGHEGITGAYDINPKAEIRVSDEYTGTRGHYQPKDDLIYMRATSDKVDDSVLHELQHAIQEREGFAKGGSPENFAQAETAKLARDARIWAKDVRNKRKSMPDADWHVVEQRLADEYREAGLPEFIPSREARDLANQPYVSYPERYPEQAADMEALIDMYGLNQRTRPRSQLDLYKSLAGEAEARLVQERMNMTPAERKAYPPMKHMEDMLKGEGISMDELIVRGY